MPALHLASALVAAGLPLGAAAAGEFVLEWTETDWAPAGSAGPAPFVLGDRHGFEIEAQIDIARAGGRPVAGYPDDLPGFGITDSLWLVWDPDPGAAIVGASSNAATVSFWSGDTPVAVDSLVFSVTDIDAAEGRCDFVTFSGDAGPPELALQVDEDEATVRIGPGRGQGATRRLLAGQAQCAPPRRDGSLAASDADDRGTVRVEYPTGTRTATVIYDESIGDVLGDPAIDAGPRGIGVFADMRVSVDNALALEKSADLAGYAAAGDRIRNVFRVTNSGPLPINSGQTVLIDDSRLGVIGCPLPDAGLAVGESVECEAADTVTVADIAADSIVSTAVAAVGLPGQAVADRLRSPPATLVTPNRNADLVTRVELSGEAATVAEQDAIAFAVTVQNRGPAESGAVELTVSVPPGLAAEDDPAATIGAWDRSSGRWTIGTLPPGEVATLSLLASVESGTAGQTLAVAATRAAGSGIDTNVDGDLLVATVTVTDVADLVTTYGMTAPELFPVAGSSVRLMVAVRNQGPAGAAGVVVPVTFPAAVAPGTVVATAGTYDASSGLWTIGSLPRGETVELSLDTVITDAISGEIAFAGPPAMSAQPDPATVGDVLRAAIRPAVTRLTMKGDHLLVDDQDGDGLAGPGDRIRYTYVVVNEGNVPVENVRVDPVDMPAGTPPPRVTSVDDVLPLGDSNGRIGVPSWRRLGPGDRLTFVAEHVVTEEDVAGPAAGDTAPASGSD